MTDLDNFTRSCGKSARRTRDHDLASGLEPVWMSVDAAWDSFSTAVLKVPTDDLKALFVAGWLEEEND